MEVMSSGEIEEEVKRGEQRFQRRSRFSLDLKLTLSTVVSGLLGT